MTLSVFIRPLEKWVHHGDERPRPKLPEVKPEPDAADGDRGNDIEPAENECALSTGRHIYPRRWADQEKHIDQPHEQNENGERGQKLWLSLKILLKKDQEWHREMEKYQDHTDREPAWRHSCQVPRRFLRNIAGPNDQPLRKIEIRPDHHHREHQFTDIMKMPFIEDVIHRYFI